MMDWDMVWKALSVILPCLLAIYTFVATRRKDVNEKLETVAKRVDTQDTKIARLETTLQSMPGRDDTHKLELLLAEMAGDMKAMRAAMDGMHQSLTRTEDIVSRHEDHLRGNR